MRLKKILRRMGYFADQQGIIDRYLREAGGWDNHLYKCREFIFEKVKLYKPKTVTILGSGWLLDVPLEELSELCETINLVDINHPPQVKLKARKYPCINLKVQDITGGMIQQIWELSRSNPELLSKVKAPVYSPDFNPGLVISLNILTQTDTLIIDYLNANFDLDIITLRQIRSSIQSAHIKFLSTVPNLLITDYYELVFDKDKVFSENNLLFTELPGGSERQEWLWDFDNAGEFYKRKRLQFKVMAIDNANQE